MRFSDDHLRRFRYDTLAMTGDLGITDDDVITGVSFNPKILRDALEPLIEMDTTNVRIVVGPNVRGESDDPVLAFADVDSPLAVIATPREHDRADP